MQVILPGDVFAQVMEGDAAGVVLGDRPHVNSFAFCSRAGQPGEVLFARLIHEVVIIEVVGVTTHVRHHVSSDLQVAQSVVRVQLVADRPEEAVTIALGSAEDESQPLKPEREVGPRGLFLRDLDIGLRS